MTPLIIGICGGSASGKSTIAAGLAERLPGQVPSIGQDAYYVDHGDISEEEKRKINFDHPDSIENTLLIEHLKQLKRGLTVKIPVYSMLTSRRQSFKQEVQPQPMIVVNGLFLFCLAELAALLDYKVFVSASEQTRMNRLLNRDSKERGQSLDYIQSEIKKYILPMHDRFIEPFKDSADLIVTNDTTTKIDVDKICDDIAAEIQTRLQSC